MALNLLSIPLISAFIGWFTNWIAIKMLFHPYRERNFLGLKIQGVLPKRQRDLARKVGQLVAEELLSSEDLAKALQENLSPDELARILDEQLEYLLSVTLPARLPVVRLFVKSELAKEIRTVLLASAGELISPIVSKVGGKLAQNLKVQSIVEEKVAGYSSEKLEAVLVATMRREFRFVELVGGVLGFLVGLVQVVLVA